MNTSIVILIFVSFLCLSAHALDCNVGNPCQLGGYFVQRRGYQCIQMGTNALCTCPTSGGYETDKPCRVCGRTNPLNNACPPSPNLLACLEIDDYGTPYACLCFDRFGNSALTTSSNCDTTVTLATTTTTIATPSPSGPCVNGGNLVSGICHCPSGYAGLYCEQKFDGNLCDKIMCKNNGVCAMRPQGGPYESVCLCRYGTFGDYCELTGTLGFCAANSCMNGGACKENVVATTRHAYCQCPAGYNGVKCENRYFPCPGVGYFVDNDMFNQGKYFECTLVFGSLRAQQRSCPKGLRYNLSQGYCTY